MTFISDDQVQLALDYLHDSADEAAEAHAQRLYLGEYRKSLKAILMKEYPKKSAVAQAAEAYSDPRYLHFLDGLKDAIKRDSKLQFLREASKAKLEAWRTQSFQPRI